MNSIEMALIKEVMENIERMAIALERIADAQEKVLAYQEVDMPTDHL